MPKMIPRSNLTLKLLLAILIISSFSYGQTSIITGTVTDQFGSLPGAKVVIEGTSINTSTDVNGNFALNIDPGQYNLKASFVMYTTKELVVNTNEDDSVHFDLILDYGFSIDQEISIGSRAKPRSLLETSVPIDVLSPQDISNSSHTELSQVLHFLLPSFHSTSQTISDGTDHTDPTSLRGLGPDQILVLVNGKRRHSSSLLNVNGTIGRGAVGTDFNAIPLAAIDRVEILRDGAAAQYGSDAIAGVVNIITKDQTSLISIDSRYGMSTEGDGASTYVATNFGLKVGEQGFVNLTAEFRDRDATNRAGSFNGPIYSNDPITDKDLIESNDFFGQTGYSEKRTMEIGQAATQNLSLFFNAEFPMSKTASFYAHGGRNYRESRAKGFYRYPIDQQKVVLELYPNGFSPEIQTEVIDNAIVLGFRGIKNSWILDFSHSIGLNEFDFTVNNSNNASLGTASPNTFSTGGFKYDLNNTNFDVSRTMNWLKGVNVAFGAEWRVERYQILEGEESSWKNGNDTVFVASDTIVRTAGAQVFPGFQPENALNKVRTNFAVYIDLEANITDNLLLGASSRIENYNDFAAQGIWKLSARQKINKALSINGGYSTGFRAPSLHQVYFNNIGTQFVAGEAVQVGTFNNQSSVTKAFKINSLKPELSRHFSLSLIARANTKTTFTVGYYLTQIKDRIVLSGQFGAGYEDILGPLNIGAAQFFTNAVDSQTNGIEGRVDFKSSLGNGNLRTSLATHINRTALGKSIKVPEALIGQESTLFNREEIARIEVGQPSFKVISLLSYKLGKMTIDINNTGFGSVKYIHPGDDNPDNWDLNELTGNIESRDQLFRSKFVTDLKFSWNLSDNFRLTVGGNNIFNIYPDKHSHSSNIDHGVFVYSRRVQQFGVQGAYYFTRLLISL